MIRERMTQKLRDLILIVLRFNKQHAGNYIKAMQLEITKYLDFSSQDF
jgi:hypothetical protein